MAKKSTARKKRKPDLATRLIVGVIKYLTLLGYVIMYPFEQMVKGVNTYRLWAIKKRKENKKAKAKKAQLKAKAKVLKQPRRVPIVIKLTGAFLAGVLFAFIFIFVPVNVYIWFRALPQPSLLALQSNNSSTKILDRKGRLLYEVYVDKKYDPVELADIPDIVIDSTLAIEDSEFYDHYGVRPLSMMRAAKATLVDDQLQGASTITQQLIKNVLLTPERTVSRKVKEVVLAVLVEQEYTKDEILEFYLNNIPYGGTAYGVQAASEMYFNKNVSELSLAEAAFLAGLPSSPSTFSPFQGGGELAKQRQYQVLSRMVDLGYISDLEAEDAYKVPLEFAPQQGYIRAPHFVAHVRQQLYEKYGKRLVDFGGLTVTTTLDLDIQDKVQEIVTTEVANNANLNISNGAAVVLDSRTGGILAHVGSINYFSDKDGKFDVVTAFRQPGSSIKPITYALALENGYTAASILSDSAVTYQSYGESYTPKNYDGKYHGNVSLRHALANSYNIPAVKLVNSLGPDNMVELGKKLGLTGWEVDSTYGLSVTLGGKETRLLDLTNVYATFARSGEYKPTTPFLSIKDPAGYEIYNIRDNAGEQVLKPETAYILTNILSDNAARTPAFGSSSQLVIPGHTVAVKTGTTNDIRDNLTLGYTPSYTVGVWVGNNDNTPMSRVASGLTGASSMWNKIMNSILEGLPDEPFVAPTGIIIKSDKECGRSEVFDKDSKVPNVLCVKKATDNDD